MDRRELEALWSSRLAEVKTRFDAARERTNSIVRKIPLADRSSESRYAYQRAVRLENAALAEYNRVLRIYTELIDRGTVPDEDDWQRRQGTPGSGSAA